MFHKYCRERRFHIWKNNDDILYQSGDIVYSSEWVQQRSGPAYGSLGDRESYIVGFEDYMAYLNKKTFSISMDALMSIEYSENVNDGNAGSSMQRTCPGCTHITVGGKNYETITVFRGTRRWAIESKKDLDNQEAGSVPSWVTFAFSNVLWTFRWGGLI
jgi:hypothetical protein